MIPISKFFILLCLFIPSMLSAQSCSDRTCPPAARYQISCHTNLLEPSFYTSFDFEKIYSERLLYVSYRDGRDLSFNPIEFWLSPNGIQMMRGSISDLRPRLAYIPSENEGEPESSDIFVRSDEWECTFYDNAKEGN